MAVRNTADAKSLRIILIAKMYLLLNSCLGLLAAYLAVLFQGTKTYRKYVLVFVFVFFLSPDINGTSD